MQDSGVPKTAEVAIVGGGIIGLSVAYHLARLGVRALVLERGRLGDGSTTRSSGGIRRLFATEPAIRLAAESVRFWERAEDVLGSGIEWRRCGYLLVARSSAHYERLRAAWHRQQRCGVPSVMLPPADVHRLAPSMDASQVVGGLYCATDGYASPSRALQAFRDAAVRLGVAIIEGCEVMDLRVRGGRIAGVVTVKGAIESPAVVNAAGVWAPILAGRAGVEIPTVMLLRHQWIVDTDEHAPSIPCVVDMDSTLFVRPEGEGYLLGIAGERPTTAYDTTVDPGAFAPAAAIAVARFPALRNARLARTWAGLTQETPDRHPVIGPAGPRGYIVAAGFSQGFMHAPAAGRAIADYITTGRSEVIALDPFRASRFAEPHAAPRSDPQPAGGDSSGDASTQRPNTVPTAYEDR
jgi:sarcosine oxidase subunit beta